MILASSGAARDWLESSHGSTASCTAANGGAMPMHLPGIESIYWRCQMRDMWAEMNIVRGIDSVVPERVEHGIPSNWTNTLNVIALWGRRTRANLGRSDYRRPQRNAKFAVSLIAVRWFPWRLPHEEVKHKCEVQAPKCALKGVCRPAEPLFRGGYRAILSSHIICIALLKLWRARIVGEKYSIFCRSIMEHHIKYNFTQLDQFYVLVQVDLSQRNLSTLPLS